MESIQRSLLMLKPDGSKYADPKCQAALKLQSVQGGLLVEMVALSLPSEGYSLYIFEKNGREHFVGQVSEAPLKEQIPALSIQDIAGAAVVQNETFEFVLKSPGPSWTEVAAKFKFTHAIPKATHKSEDDIIQQSQTVNAEEPVKNHDIVYDAQDTSSDIENDEPDAPDVCDSCPHVIRQDKINPFPTVFPDSEWVKISYPGPTGWWHYISGKIRNKDTVVAKVLGVPGEYGMAPPIWLEGFGTYMRCVTPDARGYWLMFQDAETGEVLDMGLSPHDG